MHIVVADPLPASALDLLRASGWTVDARNGRPPADLAETLAKADALVVRSATNVTAALLDAAPRLRVIARAGTGVDNVDVAAATARGIVVMNTPGANSVSVAEHALALMLALARAIPAADAAMKRGVWDKKRLTGAELRGKLLGIVGFGRIGREVAARARAFGMEIVAHDPFIAPRTVGDLGVALVTLDDLLERADYVTLHVPATPETHHLVNASTLARCRPGVRIVNTARGELIDEAALAEAIERGAVAGAALDVFETEPPRDNRLTQLPQVIATPHIAASTVEAQELVGTEIAVCVRDYLREGVIRNAVNFPSIPQEDFAKLRPFLLLADRLGAMAAQLASGGAESIGIRYYGPLTDRYADVLGSAVVAGALRSYTAESVTAVNGRAAAAERGVEIIESRSSRARDFANVISVKVRTADRERWVEGTVLENGSVRICSLDGVDVETPLEGTLIVIANHDQPGVIGDVGTALGRRRVNIGSFALGRNDRGAVGVITVDATDDRVLADAVEDIRKLPSVREAALVRV
jgi:D-3-phosphoglycerate dehydrogenase / 2-oxoglutarate reductase